MIRKKTRKFIVISRQLIDRYFSDRISKVGAELSYYFLFSVFPLLIFLFLLAPRIDISIASFENIMASFFPAEIAKLITNYFEYLRSVDNSTLMVSGLLLAIYFSAKAASSLIISINDAYRSVKKKTLVRIIQSYIMSLTIMFATYLILIFLFSGKNLLYFISKFVGISSGIIELWNILRFIIAGIILFLLLLFLYHFSRTKRDKIKRDLPGAVFALAGVMISSYLFSFYVENMSKYSLLFGSIGAIMLLMLWLYILGIIIVMGATLNNIIDQYKD